MEMSYGNTLNLARLFERRPTAVAELKGSSKYPEIRGIVYFYQTTLGVVVTTEVFGLPYERGDCKENIFAFHIHNGKSCSGNAADPFANAGGHYNPHNCRHPQHAGDLPPLFGNEDFAWSSVLTQRFTVNEVLGNAVIIHRMPDDFTTQPAGNSGEKIACGIIHR
jgi:Cu-Zn family superoxide dismutase